MNENLMNVSGSLFTLRLSDCSCLIDVIHDDAGNKHFNLRINEACGNTHLYAYESQNGLVEIDTKTGVPLKSTALTEAFLSLDLTDVGNIAAFIRKYGSFVSFPAGKYSVIDYSSLYTVLMRFQLVVSMMNALSGGNFDYLSLCNDMLLLNFGPYKAVSLVEAGDYLETCKHPITSLWYDRNENEIYHFMPPDLQDLPDYVRDEVSEPYSVYDSFKQTQYDYRCLNHMFDFEQYMSASDISADMWAKALLKLRKFHCSSYPFDANTKLLIDFLFNIALENELFLEWKGYSLSLNTQPGSMPNLTERHKEVILQLCRNTIKEEFDTALKQVHPSYNADEMVPSWNIPNLYTGLYFSLFFTNPKYEIYRRCANPGCTNVFRVRTTNNRKRYCGLACQNMAAQARHRNKIKKGAT